MLLAKSPDKGVSVTIGEENQCMELRDYSIITATYNINGKTHGNYGHYWPHPNGVFQDHIRYGLHGEDSVTI